MAVCNVGCNHRLSPVTLVSGCVTDKKESVSRILVVGAREGRTQDSGMKKRRWATICKRIDSSLFDQKIPLHAFLFRSSGRL